MSADFKLMMATLNAADRCLGAVNSTDGKGVVCMCCQTVIEDGQPDYDVSGMPVCESCINDPDKAWKMVDRLVVSLKNVQEDVTAVLRRGGGRTAGDRPRPLGVGGELPGEPGKPEPAVHAQAAGQTG